MFRVVDEKVGNSTQGRIKSESEVGI